MRASTAEGRNPAPEGGSRRLKRAAAACVLGAVGAVLLLVAGRSVFGIAISTWPALAFSAIAGIGAAGVSALAARSARSARLLRRATAASAVLAVVAAAAFGVLYAVTPGVSDAEARVRAQAAAEHSTDPDLPTPPKVAAALIATEDSRFATNPGIDLPGIARAVLSWATGSHQDAGGATLEQQLAKMLYTNWQSTHTDQVEQAVLAIKLDLTWRKSQILEMYLASAYFGNGYYGLDAAAHGYFHTSPDRLDLVQAALLAGLVQAPSAYDPVQHPALATERRAHVLSRLAATGVITPSQARADAAKPLELG